jgi:type IV pilus assembly protein PilE
MNTSRSPGKRQIGVTLLELMIAVAIVGILTAIAVPAYQAQVMRTHRGAAKSCMSEMAQQMERWYTTNLTYEGAAPAPGCVTEGNMETRYEIVVDSITPRAYRIMATPIGAQEASDTQCGVLTLTDSGEHGQSGSGDETTCWAR